MAEKSPTALSLSSSHSDPPPVGGSLPGDRRRCDTEAHRPDGNPEGLTAEDGLCLAAGGGPGRPAQAERSGAGLGGRDAILYRCAAAVRHLAEGDSLRTAEHMQAERGVAGGRGQRDRQGGVGTARHLGAGC